MSVFLGYPDQKTIEVIKKRHPTSDIKYGDTITTGGVWRSSDGQFELAATQIYDLEHNHPISWTDNDRPMPNQIIIYDPEYAEKKGMIGQFELNGINTFLDNNTNYEKIIEFKDSSGITWTWSAS